MSLAMENNAPIIIKTSPRESYIYEDDKCLAYDEELNPQALVHFLVIPKKVIPRFTKATEEDEKALGYLLLVAKDLAIKKGLNQTGYHVIVDEDFRNKRLKALHVFGRALHHMLWPLGPGCRI